MSNYCRTCRGEINTLASLSLSSCPPAPSFPLFLPFCVLCSIFLRTSVSPRPYILPTEGPVDVEYDDARGHTVCTQCGNVRRPRSSQKVLSSPLTRHQF